MRKNKLLYLKIVCFSLLVNCISCKKDLPGFKITYQIPFKVLAGISVFETQVVDLPPINSDIENLAKSNGRVVENLTKIYPTVSIIANSTNGASLSFIEWVKVFIIPQDNPSAPIILFDKVNNNTIDENKFELLAWQSNYLAELKKGSFRVRVQLKYQITPPSFMDCNLTMFFQAE